MARKHHNVAIDADGRPLPFTSAQVEDVMRRALEREALIMVAMRTESGDIACQVFGPPSVELADELDAVAKAYRLGITTPEHGGE